MSPLILLTFILYPRFGKKFALNDYLGLALELINVFDIMEMTDDLQYINNYGYFWLLAYYISVGMGILLISYPVEINSDDLNWEKNQEIFGKNPREAKSGKQSNIQVNVSSDENTEISAYYGSCEIGGNILHKNETETVTFMAKETSTCQAVIYEEKKFGLSKTDRVHLRKFLKALLTLVFIDILFATIRLKIMLTEHSAELGFNMVVKNSILTCLHSSYLLHMWILRKRQ